MRLIKLNLFTKYLLFLWSMVGKTDMVPDFLGLTSKYINIKCLALSETI